MNDRLRATTIVWAIFTMVVAIHSPSVQGALIYESATGPFDSSSSSTLAGERDTGTNSMIGAAFSVGEATAITAIGGHWRNFPGGGGTIFGAITTLDGSGFPSATALTLDDVLASVVFTPTLGADFLVPLSLDLAPGTYGLVYGSGLFGASGGYGLTLIQPGEVVTTNGTTFGSSNSSGSSGWFVLQTSPGLNRHRLLVEGIPVVSAPPSLVLLVPLLAVAAIGSLKRG